MLALTRRVNEEVVIGDPAQPLGRIRVVDIQGDKVRLAFDFPRAVEINRRELAEEKAKGPRPAAAAPPAAGQSGEPPAAGKQAPNGATPTADPGGR